MSHLWISKCVERVLLRLKHFPHCLHSNTFSVLWIALRLFIMWCFVLIVSFMGKVAKDYNEDECCVRKPGNVCKCINWEEERRSPEGDQRESRGIHTSWNSCQILEILRNTNTTHLACAESGWSHVQRSCCKAHRRTASPRCDFSSCELRARAAWWTFSRTAHTSTPLRPVPPSSWRWWCHQHLQHHNHPDHHHHCHQRHQHRQQCHHPHPHIFKSTCCLNTGCGWGNPRRPNGRKRGNSAEEPWQDFFRLQSCCGTFFLTLVRPK